MTNNIKTGEEKILGIWITIIRHGRFRPWGSRVMALSIKCDSLALRTESREEWIFSSGINCMSVWEWLEWERKCSETVVGLDLTLVLKVKNDHHFTPHGRYELNKLTSLPMCGFIAQLVEQRTGNAEVTGSNPVEALIFFRLLFSMA